jgi:hypothetical protein
MKTANVFNVFNLCLRNVKISVKLLPIFLILFTINTKFVYGAPPPATVVVKVANDQSGQPYFNSSEMKTIVDKMQSIADSSLGTGQLSFTSDTSKSADRTVNIGGSNSLNYFGDTGDGKDTNISASIPKTKVGV